MNLILRIIVNALALAAAVWFLPGMEIAGSDVIAASLGDTGSTVVAYLVIGALFGAGTLKELRAVLTEAELAERNLKAQSVLGAWDA